MTDVPEDLKAFAEAVDPFLDLVLGHKNRAIELGFSEESAEAMAVAIHAALVASMFQE